MRLFKKDKKEEQAAQALEEAKNDGKKKRELQILAGNQHAAGGDGLNVFRLPLKSPGRNGIAHCHLDG